MARVFRAPGKALVAGGYLVLDPVYNAYVTALSSRMHARIESVPVVGSDSIITVESPQFDGKWTHQITHLENFCQAATLIGNKNPFIEETIKVVLAYVAPQEPFHFHISIFSDAGFHTQENTTKRIAENGTYAFLYHGKSIDQVAKTGMGSSAGLVSVVASALLSSFLNKPASEILDIIHNVSQIAHCGAQGKIGSGFDVAAAVYGSIIYRRFKPTEIDSLLDRPVSREYGVLIRKVVDSKWDFLHQRCHLPRGLQLIMGDVSVGSETPKLVSKVLEWRKTDQNSSSVYSALDAANCRFMAELQLLGGLYDTNPEQYQQELKAGTLFMPLSNAISAIREGLQWLTTASGAEVEPSSQKLLLDKCEELPGCLGGVVPGAGGYDAVCLFVDSSQVETFKNASRKEKSLDAVTWLDLTEVSEGIVEGNPDDYRGF